MPCQTIEMAHIAQGAAHHPAIVGSVICWWCQCARLPELAHVDLAREGNHVQAIFLDTW